MKDFVFDQHRSARLREDVGCPIDLANCYLAERFGHWPWEIEDAPADRVAYYRNLLSVEAEARAITQGVDPDEEIVEIGGDD